MNSLESTSSATELTSRHEMSDRSPSFLSLSDSIKSARFPVLLLDPTSFPVETTSPPPSTTTINVSFPSFSLFR